MELDGPVDAQQLEGIAASTSQPASGKEGGKDPERFYCPYPGCNRSFAELWRLKVHFRAPPDIRGSGKERGHGTELTHCPKCGKTLKPGKHHVGCSGSKTNARQANKRSRAAGEAEPPDDALATSPTAKQLKVLDGDVEQLWPDYARPHGSQALHQMALQPSLKQEQQDWTATIQPGIIYGPNGTATACWLPGQVNGFVPQLQTQGYSQPQYPTDIQFASGSHPGYASQVSSFPSLPGYSPQSLPGLSETGPVISLPPGGTLQSLGSVAPGGLQPAGLPTLNPVIFHPQSHEPGLMHSVHVDASGHPHLQQQPQGAAAPLHHLSQAQAQAPQQQHLAQAQPLLQQPQPGLDSSCDGQGRNPGQGPPAGEAAGGAASAQAGADGRGSGGNEMAGASGNGVPGGAGGLGQQTQHAHPQQEAAKATNSGDSLGSVFGDVEEFTRDFGRIPSPPPLPADFHNASTGGNGVLFNFAQFGQKLPRTQSHTRLDKNLSAVGLGMDNGMDSELLYDHTDDGDLMQLLFGVPDELPTMATIHLHKWNNEEEEEEGEGAGEDLGSHAGRPGASTAATASAAGPAPSPPGPSAHQLPAAVERTSSQTAPPPPEQSQSLPAGDTAAVGVVQPQSQQQSQQHQQQPPSQQSQQQQPGILVNGKDGPGPHAHTNGVEPYLAHGVVGGGGGGKAVLVPQLVNGMNGQSQNHVGDEHHRDHLLDAETFRLLQSCD